MLLVFLAGVAYECSYLLWLHVSARGKPWLSAVVSVVCGAVSLYGVSAVVRGPESWPWLLAGYGVGSWVTVRYGRR